MGIWGTLWSSLAIFRVRNGHSVPHCGTIHVLPSRTASCRSFWAADCRTTIWLPSVRLLGDPELPDGQRLWLHFGLAQVLDARGEYAEAARHSSLANALRMARWRTAGQAVRCRGPLRAGQPHDCGIHAGVLCPRAARFGVRTERPIFVVGLPRSGTTLVEQILAGHSQVFGAGELPLARDTFTAACEPGQPEGTCVCGLDRDRIQWLALRHLAELEQRNAIALRVIDKMPDNYLYLGFLAALFPHVRFIHCRRDLRDRGRFLLDGELSHDPLGQCPRMIAARFRDYQRLMDRWRAVLPAPILDVSYEETVTDLETVARASWTGAGWNGSPDAWSSIGQNVR